MVIYPNSHDELTFMPPQFKFKISILPKHGPFISLLTPGQKA